MNSFKKIPAVISAFSILFAFASCGKNSPEVITAAADLETTVKYNRARVLIKKIKKSLKKC